MNPSSCCSNRPLLSVVSTEYDTERFPCRAEPSTAVGNLAPRQCHEHSRSSANLLLYHSPVVQGSSAVRVSFVWFVTIRPRCRVHVRPVVTGVFKFQERATHNVTKYTQHFCTANTAPVDSCSSQVPHEDSSCADRIKMHKSGLTRIGICQVFPTRAVSIIHLLGSIIVFDKTLLLLETEFLENGTNRRAASLARYTSSDLCIHRSSAEESIVGRCLNFAMCRRTVLEELLELHSPCRETTATTHVLRTLPLVIVVLASISPAVCLCCCALR